MEGLLGREEVTIAAAGFSLVAIPEITKRVELQTMLLSVFYASLFGKMIFSMK